MNLERMRPIYQQVIRYGQALGLDMIEGDYEDPGQLELNWMFDRAERTADRYDATGVRFPPLPLTLGEALTAFREDKVLRAALPAELVEDYLALKSDEWARFCGAVTDWERDLYTEVLS